MSDEKENAKVSAGRGRHADHEQPPPYWDRACRELASRDAVIGRLIAAHRADVLRGSGDAFQTLINAIVGQQISVAAAAGIWKRLRGAFPCFSPSALAASEPSVLRAIGLSGRKIEYVRGIARAFDSGTLDPGAWPSMGDDDIRSLLVSQRGIGPWTADMVLIFHLRRPDVLPLGDLGLVNAAARLYGWNGDGPDSASDSAATARSRKERLERHAGQWRPWRTVATWYVWRDLDAEPVVY